MNEIIVKTRKEAGITNDVLYALAQESFAQWTDRGFDAPALHRTYEEFREAVCHATVFVALEKETGDLLGMHSFYLDRKKKCANGFYLAVYPKLKRQGIASRLLTLEAERIRKAGYRYLQGDTATNASWSVNWHLKNGYRIVGYKNSAEKNYASYVFRKQLYCDLRHHPSDLLWTRPLAPLTARLCFMGSYIATRLCKRSDGSLNALGRLAKTAFIN
jgi:GNAT superfamily N-acetyltransferase